MRPHQGCEQPQQPRTDFDHGVQKLGTRLLVVWFGCVCNALDPDRGSSSTERGEFVEASEGLKNTKLRASGFLRRVGLGHFCLTR